MSSGVKGRAAGSSGSRVSIPSSVKKTIENIKEITGQNHSEDEIYAMLKECSMDPNETTQRLLLLDTFHEVKRKRDRRKEIVNKEAAESKLKPGTPARANRGRGNFSSRCVAHDAGVGRNSATSNENASRNLIERGTRNAQISTSQEMKKDGISSSSVAAVSGGPSGISSLNTKVLHDSHLLAGGVVDQSSVGDSSANKSEGPQPVLPPVDSVTKSTAPEMRDIQQLQMLDSSNSTSSIHSAPISGSYSSSSDPVLPSQELPLHNAASTVQCEFRESIADSLSGSKPDSARISSPGGGSSNLRQKMPDDSQGVGDNQHLEAVLPASSTVGVSTVSRPSSNYNNRSQVIGPQKVGLGKEWKPKSAHSAVAKGATVAASPEISTVSVGSHPILQTTSGALTLKEDDLELQRKLEESHISDRQHVIIPDHLHVPEAEKLGFCFGSFDASFGLDVSHNGAPVSDKIPASSEFEAIGESVKGLQSSYEKALVNAEDTEIKNLDQAQSPTHGLNSYAIREVEVSSSVALDGSKQEIDLGNNPHPEVHTSSNYNLGFMPPIVNGQLTTSESSESQVRDAPRQPGFVVQQSFDPASYYAQFYRTGMDNDGRLSLFQSTEAGSKYNGNSAMVSPQTSQSSQEMQSGGPQVLSTPSHTPHVTQSAGVMQSSINNQHPFPIFRPPTGVHIPHYPPNYIPYAPYFSPFYVPPPAIHQFFSNSAFPQQPQAANLYPTPPGATANYAVPQQKQGSNTVNSTHVGVPGSYAPYGLSMSNYTSSSATASVTSTSNEDHAAPQVKDNNIYNEGSGVWFTTPSRDISTLQASSFYNLPQGQLAFTPTQTGHGSYPGIFHQAQAVTATTVHPLLQHSQPITSPADVTGPAATVYQQSQHHQQLNWPNNY